VSLAKRRPDVASEFHPTLNPGLSPATLSVWSQRRVYWQCNSPFKHVFIASVKYRVRANAPCPFCRWGSQGRRMRGTSLAFRRPDLKREWHAELNGDLRPEDIPMSATQSAWWQCTADPAHVWHASIAFRVKRKDSTCPMCTGRTKRKLPDKACLAISDPSLSKQWHPTRNAPLTPRLVARTSSLRVWWRCLKNPAHVWQRTVRWRSTCELIDCPFCERSLQATRPDLAKEWHPHLNGNLAPIDVMRTSTLKVWWRCSVHREHVWQASVRVRAFNRKGNCPHCRLP